MRGGVIAAVGLALDDAAADAVDEQLAADQVVRDRDVLGLDRWLADAASSELPPFVGFTRGIATDRAAVNAAFTLPRSTGPVEGQVHKIKLLKRQVYGRAGLPQLRARILAA